MKLNIEFNLMRIYIHTSINSFLTSLVNVKYLATISSHLVHSLCQSDLSTQFK